MLVKNRIMKCEAIGLTFVRVVSLTVLAESCITGGS